MTIMRQNQGTICLIPIYRELLLVPEVKPFPCPLLLSWAPPILTNSSHGYVSYCPPALLSAFMLASGVALPLGLVPSHLLLSVKNALLLCWKHCAGDGRTGAGVSAQEKWQAQWHTQHGWTNAQAAPLASLDISPDERFQEKINSIGFDGDPTAHKSCYYWARWLEDRRLPQVRRNLVWGACSPQHRGCEAQMISTSSVLLGEGFCRG